MEDQKQFKLLIPVDLKERVQEAARQNGRSLSQEINFALSERYPENELPWVRPTRHELELEGKVSALEHLVADLFCEAIDDGRSTKETVQDWLRLRNNTAFHEEAETDWPDECSAGARITIARVSAQVAMANTAKRLRQEAE